MACDICGKTGVPLQQLTDTYKTAKINDLCDDCMRDVNKALSDIRSMTYKMNTSLTQRFMNVMKEKFLGW